MLLFEQFRIQSNIERCTIISDDSSLGMMNATIATMSNADSATFLSSLILFFGGTLFVSHGCRVDGIFIYDALMLA
ncbi:hypothetical protein DdX_15153 [Ditylenchus destructor]|uniref:Uncharacterized protein n=1 Tax=Ditylenchus destructor TaxID=166010 RepID=A0AAD4MVS7_9BILA|nr:hypothetical protein DdX_15153 [Ditylenchus destructor]